MRTFTQFLLVVGLLISGNLFAADTTNALPLRKVAIVVENHAGAQFNDKVPVLEDLLSSRIAGEGYSVISRDVTVNALKSYDSAGVAVSSQRALNANAGNASADQAAAAEAVQTDSGQLAAAKARADKASGRSSANLDLAQSDSAQVAVTPATTQLDQALSDNTSALRLAQNLGADFILIPSITTYGTEKKTYVGNGIATVNLVHTLRVSYKIAEAGAGGEINGGTVTATKAIRQSDSLQVDDTDVVNELLADAAEQLADTIAKNTDSLPAAVAKDKMVNFNIACSMTDPRQQPILISAVGITADNRVIATNQPVVVQPMDVTVELDGVALGSAPGAFQAYPGLHKLRLSREGFDDWTRTINVYEGQTLQVALQMSAAGYARWADTTAFLASLDNNRKLTDAEAEKVRGLAKFFSESHYRIDATNYNSVNYYNGRIHDRNY